MDPFRIELFAGLGHGCSASSFRGAPTGPRKARPDDRLRASPESITTTGSMDSGPAPKGASRNDESKYFVRNVLRPEPNHGTRPQRRTVDAARQRARAHQRQGAGGASAAVARREGRHRIFPRTVAGFRRDGIFGVADP